MSRFDGRRLSLTRLTVLLVLLAGATFAGTSGWHRVQDSQAAAADGDAWFAGYVDATVTPYHEFEDSTSRATRDVVLSFVVAAPDEPCTPSWGGAYTIADASDDVDLDRRIALLRQRRGSVVVSFGGAVNTELATACTDPDELLAAYRDVVEHYDLRTIDLDIEGEGLNDTEAAERRAVAMRALQVERHDADRDLRIWLTLPATPDGLTPEGRASVQAMLAHDVDLSGVNIMTMNYGGSRREGQSMLDASIAALTSTHRQLDRLYDDADQGIGSATLWRRMGATPMVGQNDSSGEIFTMADARGLASFAREKGLGRMSMWSLNRDRTCGANYPDLSIVSNACSGVDQGSETFARALQSSMSGRPDVGEVAPVAPDSAERDAAAALEDDPATSPYPIWSADETYVEGTRVVWHRNAYVSKWWTFGDVPDDPVVDVSASPWQLLGPVLPGERPVEVPSIPAGTYPEWDQDAVYRTGQRVMLRGTAFTAKWYSEGISPDARASRDEPSPWRRLTDTELREVARAADRDDG